MNFHFYADDCQVYFSFDSVSSDTIKTELLVIGSCKLPAFELPSFKATDGSVIEPSHFARNMFVIFDNKLNMEHQVSAICKSAFFSHPEYFAD